MGCNRAKLNAKLTGCTPYVWSNGEGLATVFCGNNFSGDYCDGEFLGWGKLGELGGGEERGGNKGGNGGAHLFLQAARQCDAGHHLVVAGWWFMAQCICKYSVPRVQITVAVMIATVVSVPAYAPDVLVGSEI